MRFENITLDKIKVSDRARQVYTNLEDLAESIKTKGLIHPLLLDEDLTLIAGGRRLAAAQLAGLKKLPCIIRTVKNELDAKELELIENLQREDMRWWEECLLVKRIYDLFTKNKKRKWTATQTAQLMGKSAGTISRKLALAEAIEQIPSLQEAPTEEAAVKQLKKLQEALVLREMKKDLKAEATQQREEPLLGEEQLEKKQLSERQANIEVEALRVANSNYIVNDFFLGVKELAANTFDFIEVDPPYGIDLDKHLSTRVDKDHANAKQYTEIPRDEYEKFIGDLCWECYRVAKPNAWMVLWFGIQWYATVKKAAEEAGWLVDIIPAVWDKGEAGKTAQAELNLARVYEPFFVCRKGQPLLLKRGRANIFRFKPVPLGEKTHPTQRPIELITELLDTFCLPGSKVLVPFAGSGATLVAVYKRNLQNKDGAWTEVKGYDLSKTYKAHFLLSVKALLTSSINKEKADASAAR